MGKLILAMFVSLDGFIEGPGGELVPPAWSDDLQRHWSDANLDLAGAVLYGRACYEGMAYYWQLPSADQHIAGRLAGLPKYVLSRSHREMSWKNSFQLQGDVASEINELKLKAPGDIVAFGGAGLARALIQRDLIDEYRLMITPTLLGGGKRLFDVEHDMQKLALVEALQMDTGAMIMHYRRQRN